MKVKISSLESVTLVELSGYLDFGSSEPVLEQIENIYRSDQKAKVVVDMSDLEFVGSSGISNFVKGLRSFNKLQMRPSYCGVKIEFQKLFRMFEDKNTFEVFDQRELALINAKERYRIWEMNTMRSPSTH